ncbi:MAG TPA: hypothetical protein VMV37_13275 [Gammaproteobacteria bacterium]|nr:hypothetical protein [Gammaproteobacteria bacterium]
MKKMAIALVSSGLLMAAVSLGFAKELSTTGLEEAFIDAVGTCGPSSSVAGSLGKSSDPAVKIALRDALIVEAADDAAGVPGANASHSECMKKELSGRGYSAAQEAALPYCVKHDWPDPFTSLGQCVQSHGRLEGAMTK